jgi:acetoin utilization deacetylase AcuC-like enzyme
MLQASMTHSLIEAYELLSHMTLVKATPASTQDIALFHSEDYVSCLQKLSESDDKEKLQEEAEEYGLCKF